MFVIFDNINFCVEFEDGRIVVGELKIFEEVKSFKLFIKRVFIILFDVKLYFEVLDEIERVDVIIIGSGSFYISIMLNFVFKEVVESIKKSRVKKIYIVNIMMQLGEIDGYFFCDYIEVIERYCGGKIFDIVIVNN